ncbi:hypothetical protein AB0O52_17445 [Arthrobacter sp. NPDC080073]|uniref:hypothetical protein n=1 Tax=Arthrobacter sp. NPDC080073 TaxID=3155919 RepID=UPI003431AC76
MAKVTRAHIIAARARRDILKSQKKPIPPKIVKLADLDITKFPRSAVSVSVGESHPDLQAHPAVRGWLAGHMPLANHFPWRDVTAKEESTETERRIK